MKYRPDIDGLRALAVLAVMVYHLNPKWLPGGFIGVDVFFAISGFVICASLATANAVSVVRFIGQFYARRLARIVPALVAMLVVTSAAATLFIPRAWLSDLSGQTARYAYAGLSNWILASNADTYFAPRAELNPYTHTWSLGVEEQFYVMFPALCFVWVAAQAQRVPNAWAARATGLLAGLGTLSLFGSRWATSQQPILAFYSVAFRFWELAAGALLYQVTAASYIRAPRSALNNLVSPWLGLLAVGSALVWGNTTRFPYPWAIAAVVGTLLMIGGAGAASHPLRQRLASPVAVWIGKRSYSLYLWHWPVYVLLRWTVGMESPITEAVAVTGTVVLASASYRAIELPLRHNKTIERYSSGARIAFFLLLIALGWKVTDRVVQTSSPLSVVSKHADDWYPERFPPDRERARNCSVQRSARPFGAGAIISFRPSHCSAPLVVPGVLTVFGDSHAGAYFPSLDEIAMERGIPVDLYTLAGCGYLSLIIPMADQASECVSFWRAASVALAESSTPNDVLFLANLRLRKFVDQWAAHDAVEIEREWFSSEAAALRSAAQKEAREWLRPFAANGVGILFEAPKPLFTSPPFRCSDWFNRHNPICHGGGTLPRAVLEQLRAPILATMHDLAGIYSSVRIWDPVPLLCSTDSCEVFAEGRPLFFDGDHISGYGNSVLYSSWSSDVFAMLTKNMARVQGGPK